MEPAAPPTPAQLKQIEDFLRHLFVAQHWDTLGGLLGEPSLLGADNLARGHPVQPAYQPSPDKVLGAPMPDSVLLACSNRKRAARTLHDAYGV
jgi:hypothetical protein